MLATNLSKVRTVAHFVVSLAPFSASSSWNAVTAASRSFRSRSSSAFRRGAILPTERTLNQAPRSREKSRVLNPA